MARSHQLSAAVVALALLSGAALYLLGGRSGAGPRFSVPGDEPLVDGPDVTAPPPRTAEGRIEAEVTVALEPIAALLAAAADPVDRLQLRSADGESTAEGRIEVIAGTACVPFGPGPRAGDLQVLRLHTDSAAAALRLVRWPEADAALALRLGPPVVVRGRVQDADGRPVVGARVRLGAGAPAVTGEDGSYAVEGAGGEGCLLSVTALAHAGERRVLDLVQGGDLELPPLTLAEGASLRVRVVGARAAGGQPARLLVLPAGAPRHSGEASYPWFLAALDGGVEVAPTGDTDVVGLPGDAEVRVVLDHPLLEGGASEVITTRRGRAVEVVVHARPTPVLSGRVLDLPGGFPLWVAAAADAADDERAPAHALALPARAYLGSRCACTVARDGRFRVGLPVGGGVRRSRVVLRRAGAPGLVVMVDRATDGEPLSVPWPAGAIDTAAPARLLLSARPGAARLVLRVRVVEAGSQRRGWISWRGDEALPLPLRLPVIADVTVRVRAADGTSTEASHRAMVLAGDVPLAVEVPP